MRLGPSKQTDKECVPRSPAKTNSCVCKQGVMRGQERENKIPIFIIVSAIRFFSCKANIADGCYGVGNIFGGFPSQQQPQADLHMAVHAALVHLTGRLCDTHVELFLPPRWQKKISCQQFAIDFWSTIAPRTTHKARQHTVQLSTFTGCLCHKVRTALSKPVANR